jgi:DNA polymerase I-like protein with 3'-5' exonuclease and polymerase domains
MKVFDIESDGLLDTISKVHCINVIDQETGEELRFTDHEYYQNVDGSTSDERCPRQGDLAAGLQVLEGDDIAGHYIIGYDIPALQIVYPEWTHTRRQLDTKTLGKLIYPNLRDMDHINIRKGKYEVRPGCEKLVSWGKRAGQHQKADFDPKDYGHTWATMPFTKEMDDYCMDDVRTNLDVLNMYQNNPAWSDMAADLECAVARIINWQERTGVRFDVKAAEEFAGELYVRLHELENEARAVFSPFYKKDGKAKQPAKAFRRFVEHELGAVTRKHKGEEQRGWWCFTSGIHQPVILADFNPGSRPQIENRLRWKYDWEPTEFTDKGAAKIDEDVLSSLPFVEAKTISEFFMVQKRLSQLAEGDQAWLKKVKDDGRIYGRVDQLGTGTGRMSHFGPNLAQVPKNEKPYGRQCRGLFVHDEGRVIVGMDADALELRILAHFLAAFDSGEYARTVLDGNSADGTDMHSRNRDAIGLMVRDTAKTWFYAFIYGAGNFKLGTIVMSEWDEDKLTRFYKSYPPGERRRRKTAAIGKMSREKLMHSIPAFAKLVKKVHTAAERGWVKGLDGRRIPIRSVHSSLNFVCQGAGALAMKRALVYMFERFAEEQLDVLPLLNIHDEVQLSALPEEAEHVGEIAAAAVAHSGDWFGLRCPLAGNYDIGSSWAETH